MPTHEVSPVLEDYLEAIFRLISEKGAARVRDIADALSVHKSTVTAALHRLTEEELLDYKPYELARLTPKGRRIAKEVARRHDILVDFLSGILKLDRSVAAENACRMEHVLDREVLERISSFGQFVGQCPRTSGNWLERFEYFYRHGGMPPGSESDLQQWLEDRMKEQESDKTATTLNRLKAGDKATIVKVGGSGPLRRRIVDMGVVKGAPVEVQKVAPLGDPIEVKIKGYSLSLRKAKASAIDVKRDCSYNE
jgi:DtxR family Mn-dependent transcriptional regulator